MLLPFLVTALSLACSGQEPLRHIDFYGNRTIPREVLIEALGADVGDSSEFDRKAAAERLRGLDGVADALVVLMSMPGRHSLMLGIEEVGAPKLEWRPEPEGDERLPLEWVALHDEALELTMEGLMAGEAGEEVRDGYGLSEYAPARARELRLIELARQHADLLPVVLERSSDAKHRSVAATCSAYLDDKSALQVSLAAAMLDSDSAVRNNATRALLVLAEWANDQEEVELSVDWAPALVLLESVEWTDRNKASGLLLHWTEARDPRLLGDLRESAIPALAEMARWSLAGYSFAPLMILGRLGGADDGSIRTSINTLSGSAREAWIDGLVERAAGRRG